MAVPGAALAGTQADAPEGEDDAFDDGPEGDAGDGFEAADTVAPLETASSEPEPAPQPVAETFAPAAPEPVVHESAPLAAAAPPVLEEPATAPAVRAPEPAAHPADPAAPPDAAPAADDPTRT